MSTKFLSPGWRMPRNANQSKSSNYSLDFDGSGSQYINFGTDVLVDSTSSFSISGWCYINNFNSITFPGIGRFKTDQSTGFFFGVSNYIGYEGVYFGSSSNFVLGKTSGDISGDFVGQWKHITIVFDGVSRTTLSSYKVYVDSSEVSTTTSGSFNTVANENRLGEGNGTNTYLDGKLDGVAIYNYALSSSQVTTLWGGGTEVSNPMALPSPPIAYYPLGESAGGFVGGSGTWLTENNAIEDYVFDFNGSSNYIDCGNDSSLNISGDLTISAWVKINNYNSYNAVISKIDSSTRNYEILIRPSIPTGGISFYVANSNFITSTGTVPLNTWTHIVVSVESGVTNGAKIYINGSQDSTTGTLTINSNTANLNIGRRTTNAFYMNGKMSNAQVFNTALSGPEVETLYNYGSPIQTLANIPQSSNLKAWYKLDATEIYNSTSTEWSVDNNQNPSAYPSSLDFSGTSQYISCSSSSVFQNTSNFSVSFWVNMDDYSGGGCFLMSQGSGSNIFHIYAYSGNTIQVRLRKDGLGNGTISNINLNNKWNNICLVYDGTQTGNSNMLKFYLNKVEQTINFNSDIQSSINISSNFLIGQQYGQSGIYTIDGKLSNVSLFSNSLTDGTGGTLNQIETLYNNGTPLADMSSFSSLVSWWKLDNTTTGIEDSKGTNNGTNNGATEYPGFVNALAGESTGMSQSNLVQSDLQTVAPYSKYALDFDGTDYIETLNNGPNITQVTLSAWIKRSGTQSDYNGVLGVRNSGGAPHYGVAWDLAFQSSPSSTNKIQFRVGDGTNAYKLINSNSAIPDNTWTHVAGVLSGTNVLLYINGALQTETETFTGTLLAPNSKIFIGSQGLSGSNEFVGSISNPAVWNTGLSASKVREIYNEGLPSDLNTFSGTAPIAWWQLGENSSFNGNDWIVADEIGSNNGESDGMGVDALTNGVGTTANGVSSGMSEGSLIGDAPYSTANAISSGMAVTARGTDVPPTP